MESNFRTLYYYIVTAEELNFTRAAQKLYITQQSLSAHIKKLEAQYEVVLFERRPALRLTLAGERLLKYAKQVIEDENNLFNDFKNENAIGRIRLNIGIPPQRILPYLPDIYQAYHRKQPHVIPSCVSYSYIDADLALRAGNIQLYFSILSQPVKFGTQQFLGDDTLYFVISAELLRNTCPETWRDFLSRYVKGISITDTIDFPVILPPLISSQRLMMNLLYDKLGYSPNVQMETADNAVALELCVRGCCGAFLPKSYLANAYSRHTETPIYFFPVTDMQGMSTLSIVYAEAEPLPEHIKDYIDCAREIISTSGNCLDLLMNEELYEN